MEGEFNAIQPSATDIPGRLRVGDVDSDGYPDILLTTTQRKFHLAANGDSTPVQLASTDEISTSTYVLKNEECSNARCGEEATRADRRYYKSDDADFKEINNLVGNQVVVGTFMDIDEDGRLDIIVQSREREKDGSYTNVVQVIYNNYVRDTFFIKALMLNSYKSYGDVVIGPSFRAIITDLDDNKKVVIGSQLT